MSNNNSVFAGTTRDAQQLWVHAHVWHHRKSSHRLPVTVLLDTGAGGGNYASHRWWKSLVPWGNVTGKLCTIGSGFLRAANPSGSNIPPMRIRGSAVIPIRFHPKDRVRKVWVRVVDGLPYGFILGASFFRRNKSTLSLSLIHI